jgi:Acylphosphatases
MNVRKEFRFTGTVQGVGFRYTAYHAARALGLTGWVRNEYDGSVTMEVQGGGESVEAVVAYIERNPSVGIEAVQSADIPLDSEERTFSIR